MGLLHWVNTNETNSLPVRLSLASLVKLLKAPSTSETDKNPAAICEFPKFLDSSAVMAPKTVCIVGAGPSGLVAAKTLLHNSSNSNFSVTIFDAQPRIGGLWPLEKSDGAGLLHPLMVANQSKHTIQFSDLAWEKDAPQFPKAWQVGRYLQRYLRKYCSFEEDRFRLRLGWKVEKALPIGGGNERKWRVTVKSEDGLVDENEYDYLLVSSGFFGKPMIPDLPGLNGEQTIPIIHSSRYRDLETLLPNANGKGGKILVVGGQMSGVEIAGTISSHISSAANTPGPNKVPGSYQYTVHHIIQRPTWVLPLFTSPAPNRAAAPFMPLDLPSYNLANRPQPLQNTQGHIPVTSAKITYGIYKNILGTDQSEFSPLLAPQGDDVENPQYLAAIDYYMDFVRSGLITVSKGKLDSVSANTATVSSISPSEESTTITDIAAIVLATGFEAAPSISFLPSDIQQTLSVDPSNLKNTLLLAFHGTHHPDILNLGFVGFYRSPYWGVMEMHARFISELWTQQQAGQLSPAMQRALAEDTSIQRCSEMRGDPRVSQFPMGDYGFLLQEFSTALDMEISPSILGDLPPLPHNNKPMDIITPARYTPKDLSVTQKAEVEESLRQTRETALAGLTKGKFVARAVFRSLLGEWQLERDLISKLPSHPSGHWSGTAKFLLRQGTSDGLQCVKGDDTSPSVDDENDDTDSGLEYLYIEEGIFSTNTGISFPATRRYVWRYDETTDKLSVWFVRTGDKFSRKDPKRDEEQMRADYLFHEVEFLVPTQDSIDNKNGWEAKAGHLCVEDFYDVKYQFVFNAVNLKEWRLSYTVNGPQKDYTIDGTYRRKAI